MSPRRRFLVACSVGWLSAGLGAAAQELTASNTAHYRGDERWDWKVFLKASPEVLSRIRCVEYTLHPTFPNPARKVCSPGDSQSPFALSSNGWGTFRVPIKVTYRDGRVQYLSHQLSFQSETVHLPITADNTAAHARPGLWNWTVFLHASEEILKQIKCVEYTLHPTFPNPIQSVCSRGAGPRAFPLDASGWGTFAIGIQVFFHDGRRQQLKDTLHFP